MELATAEMTNEESMIANNILRYTDNNICSLPSDAEKIVQFMSKWKTSPLAEDGFDPSTSGLWAQHASAAPLCYTLSWDEHKFIQTRLT